MGDGFLQRFEAARGPRHPLRVNAEDHFDARVSELRRDMLRRVAMLDREAREGVTALVDRARADLSALKNARPVARANVCEIDRVAHQRRENQIALESRACLLIAKCASHWRNHLDIA